jgi:UDP-N-acetyl-D-mannosaminuronic acid transferase (WecB/TagA/CpsF family)
MGEKMDKKIGQSEKRVFFLGAKGEGIKEAEHCYAQSGRSEQNRTKW